MYVSMDGVLIAVHLKTILNYSQCSWLVNINQDPVLIVLNLSCEWSQEKPPCRMLLVHYFGKVS